MSLTRSALRVRDLFLQSISKKQIPLPFKRRMGEG
jgi:hypothetical protein